MIIGVYLTKNLFYSPLFQLINFQHYFLPTVLDEFIIKMCIFLDFLFTLSREFQHLFVRFRLRYVKS